MASGKVSEAVTRLKTRLDKVTANDVEKSAGKLNQAAKNVAGTSQVLGEELARKASEFENSESRSAQALGHGIQNTQSRIGRLGAFIHKHSSTVKKLAQAVQLTAAGVEMLAKITGNLGVERAAKWVERAAKVVSNASTIEQAASAFESVGRVAEGIGNAPAAFAAQPAEADAVRIGRSVKQMQQAEKKLRAQGFPDEEVYARLRRLWDETMAAAPEAGSASAAAQAPVH